MSPTAIGLIVAGVAGMLGWIFAWLAQREVVAKGNELAAAIAGETAAQQMTVVARSEAVTARMQLTAERDRTSALQLQLDAERNSRQHLVDELAKRGLPVGDAVVASSLDRLYPPGGGQGADAGSGGGAAGVSGQPAPASGAPRSG